MDAATSLLGLAVKNNIVRSIAYQLDKLNGSHVLESFYKADLFRSPLVPQEHSPLMELPPEIRARIYDWIITVSCNEKSSKALAFLSTCRLIHGEAYVKAYQTFEFKLNGEKGLVFGKKVWNLGSLQRHLRHIEVTIPIAKLDALGSNNPFILTTLPLNILKIDFGEIETKSWRCEVAIYHRLISALLYRSSPRELGNTTAALHTSLLGKRKRDIELATWQFFPKRKELYDVMLRAATKKLIVQAKDGGKDIIWSAFTHFDLIDHYITKIKVKGGRPELDNMCYLMFGDEKTRTFFEMAKKVEPAWARGTDSG